LLLVSKHELSKLKLVEPKFQSKVRFSITFIQNIKSHQVFGRRYP
jgi:hypothetical protein